MNYEMVIEELQRWNEDESFYRSFYDFINTKPRNEEELKQFFEGKKPQQRDIDIVLHPSNIHPYETEELFFTSERNVTLIKHPRYIPYFEHQHAFFEMIYVLSGQCKQILNDCTICLEEGELFLMAPNVSHGIEVFDDSVVINILIRHSTFLDIFLNTIRDKSQISLFLLGNMYDKNKIRYLLYHTAGDIVVRNYILDMYMEQMHMDKYSDRIICSLMTIFFIQLTRRHGRTAYVSDTLGRKVEYGTEMLSYIMDHYNEITLADLAEHFHFSVPYCSTIVKTISGVSFSDFITKIRLQQGENMLVHTQMSVADISYQIGYKNPETFIRCFHRYYHMSPSQFRKDGISGS